MPLCHQGQQGRDELDMDPSPTLQTRGVRSKSFFYLGLRAKLSRGSSVFHRLEGALSKDLGQPFVDPSHDPRPAPLKCSQGVLAKLGVRLHDLAGQ